MKADAKTLSLKRLAKDFGVDVLSLPITVFNSDMMDGTPAYISESGIHIARSVVENEPQNIHVYLGHEVMHSVIHNDEDTGLFSSMLVNVAEDYKINQFLKEVFGYDVTAVGVKGLLSRKYNKMSVSMVCKCLGAGKQGAITPCKTKWTYHPRVFEQAMRLRRRFEEHLGVASSRPTEFFHLDAMDNRAFHDFVGGDVAKKIRVSALKGMNVNRVMHGLWAHLYLENLVAVEPTAEQLLSSQSLVWGLPGDKLRKKSRGDMDISMLTAQAFLERVDEDEMHLRMRLIRACDAVSDIKDLLAVSRAGDLKRGGKRVRLSKVEIHDLRTKLVKLKQKIVEIEALKPLPELMNKRRVSMLEARKIRDSVKRQCLSAVHTVDLGSAYRSEVKLPKFDRTDEIIKRLRLLGNVCLKKSESTAELARKIENQLGPLVPKPGGPANGGGSSPTQSKAAGDKKGEGRRVGEDTDEKGGAGPSPSKGAGSSSREPKSRLEMLQAVGNISPKLEDVLAKMSEIETMLKVKRSPKPSETSHDMSILGYGNDLERVVSSELALLSIKETELAFLAKYAEHSLLQINPTEKRRFPIVFCVDCSGSMHGEFYATAVGFVLAMTKRLHKDKRGSAFIMFSTSVENYLVVRPDEPFDAAKLIYMLSTPSYGGTDFGPAFSKAYDIKDAEGWKSAAVMLVSDGYGGISNLAELRARKSMQDRWVGIIVSGTGTKKIEGLDEIWSVNKQGFMEQLVSSAASLL